MATAAVVIEKITDKICEKVERNLGIPMEVETGESKRKRPGTGKGRRGKPYIPRMEWKDEKGKTDSAEEGEGNGLSGGDEDSKEEDHRGKRKKELKGTGEEGRSSTKDGEGANKGAVGQKERKEEITTKGKEMEEAETDEEEGSKSLVSKYLGYTNEGLKACLRALDRIASELDDDRKNRSLTPREVTVKIPRHVEQMRDWAKKGLDTLEELSVDVKELENRAREKEKVERNIREMEQEIQTKESEIWEKEREGWEKEIEKWKEKEKIGMEQLTKFKREKEALQAEKEKLQKREGIGLRQVAELQGEKGKLREEKEEWIKEKKAWEKDREEWERERAENTRKRKQDEERIEVLRKERDTLKSQCPRSGEDEPMEIGGLDREQKRKAAPEEDLAKQAGKERREEGGPGALPLGRLSLPGGAQPGPPERTQRKGNGGGPASREEFPVLPVPNATGKDLREPPVSLPPPPPGKGLGGGGEEEETEGGIGGGLQAASAGAPSRKHSSACGDRRRRGKEKTPAAAENGGRKRVVPPRVLIR